MNINHFILKPKPELVEWQPGMVPMPGMVVRCYGNDLMKCIEAARVNGCEVLTLRNKGTNSEWHATISAKQQTIAGDKKEQTNESQTPQGQAQFSEPVQTQISERQRAEVRRFFSARQKD